MIKASAEHYGKPVDVAYKAFALLSWQTSIARNLELYTLWLMGADLTDEGLLPDQLRRMHLIDAGKVEEAIAFKTGRKLASFAHNLAHPWAYDGVVTADRHHIRAAFDNMDKVQCTPAQYERIRLATVANASKLGLRAQAYQAIIWEHVRMCETRG
jgi:hypothetical protein